MLLRILPLLLLAISVVPATAQQRLAEGSQIRVAVLSPDQQSTSTYQGTLRYTANTFSLEVEQGATVPMTRVQAIEMYRPADRVRSGRWGAVWGTFLGTSLGLIAGPIIARETDYAFGPTIATSTAVGFGAGALLGGVTGALLAHDQWQRYQVPAEWR